MPPPLQSAAASSSTAASTSVSGAGPSLPPMPPPPPPHLSTTAKAGSSNNHHHNGGASSGAEAETDETVAAASYARPAVALSADLLELYKLVNAQYCAQRRLESPGPKYNNGYDDKDGHYVFLPGEVIFQRYIAQEVLGKGSFGTVIRGFDQKRSEAVAMKITRRGSSFRSQAKLELDILLRVNENQALNHLVVRLLKVFEWQGHLVLVFELLSFNLYQLIKCTRFNGVSLDLVRKFAYQLTHTLLQLESQKPHPIIHCDLKPENILLRNQNRSGIRLIDFGSACYTVKRFHRYIQSRFYRSPEVILFLEYGTAIDRWSLACVLVELHTGVPLFDGRTEAAQLSKFECTLGPVPAEMIAASPKASRFYFGSLAAGFQLKEPVPERRGLESVLGVATGGPRGRRLDTPGHDEKSYREFLDFVARLLRYQPEERMSCRDALQHPFLMPLYMSDLMQQQEREAQHRQQQSTLPQQPPQQPSHPQPQPQPSPSRSAAKKNGSDGSPLTAEE
ncbi:putative Serine/threonine-protein kinase [Leptomonas pyrrhocoris]|uniref:Putative Serine/threonine-protein kinase n=1 Tax=Leptomonas pyrrhocoris TaxID=157538 RepID=A0A0M9FPF2_LEPPY|nr:putative Serine/threonine-protein kinase [Leptomonas pyrrhocoris]KPA73283.1 putative Serine/threonine-protein kinase [Leptomonas pyrrhocoris]|eukprot:XP_015651722.1 putative Serine/threonine-protein kinase [Leptomonas pyrrhocoris]